jgi:hypothetical protein
LPSDIISTRIIPDRYEEQIVFMDDYGSAQHLYVNIALASQRATRIAETQTAMDAKELALEAYAKANGHDISGLKSTGLAKKAAAMKSGGIAPAPAAPTVSEVKNG